MMKPEIHESVAVAKVAAATDLAGERLAIDATTLNTIADNQHKILAEIEKTPGVSAEAISQLKSLADSIKTTASAIQNHSEFAKSVATYGVVNPIPMKVPLSAPVVALI